MFSSHIPDGDRLFRHVNQPQAFTSGAFVIEKFFHFKEAFGKIETSLAWALYLPAEADVHQYGCRLAKQMNDDKRARNKYKAQNRTVYCGAYVLTARDIRMLIGLANLDNVAGIEVIHQVERGQLAHAALIITLNHSAEGLEGTKTAIADRLWNVCRGPLRFTCHGDTDLMPHPNERLPIAPLGEFDYARGFLSVLFRKLKCRLHQWDWHRRNREQVPTGAS